MGIVILKKEKEPPVLLIQTTSNKLVLSEINVNWHRKTKVTKFKERKLQYNSK